MSEPPDDPALQQFLASQRKPGQDADSPEMQRLFEHTRSSPPRAFRLDAYAKAGIGIVVVLVILRIVIMLLS